MSKVLEFLLGCINHDSFDLLNIIIRFYKIVRALGLVTPFLIIMVILIAVFYLFTGSISLGEVNSAMPETSAWKGIFWGLVYGGLAFAVGFSTIVAIGGDASKRRVSGAGAMFGGAIRYPTCVN